MAGLASPVVGRFPRAAGGWRLARLFERLGGSASLEVDGSPLAVWVVSGFWLRSSVTGASLCWFGAEQFFRSLAVEALHSALGLEEGARRWSGNGRWAVVCPSRVSFWGVPWRRCFFRSLTCSGWL